MTATHDDALLRRVEQFLFDQSDMLDSRRWQDWINLFTKDGVYWMPADPAHESGDGVPSIFHEDLYMMRTRMKRLNIHAPGPSHRHRAATILYQMCASMPGDQTDPALL